jgi:hypothetical protein
MPELSPAAQAVFDAFCCEARSEPHHQREAIAAALRAAVAHTQQHHNHDVWKCDADELLAIAEELEIQ